MTPMAVALMLMFSPEPTLEQAIDAFEQLADARDRTAVLAGERPAVEGQERQWVLAGAVPWRTPELPERVFYVLPYFGQQPEGTGLVAAK